MSSVHANVAIAPEALDQVQTGTVFEKTAIGWNVKWVDGGTVVHLQGATITEALGSHGAQVIHVIPETRPDPRLAVDEIEIPEPIRASEIPDGGHEALVVEHRSPDQDAALEAAFVAGVLPEKDRRHEGDE